MELSLENLDKIYRVLAVSCDGSHKTLDQIDLNETLEQTEHNREVLNIIFKRMGAYLLEISHVDSFLQQSVNAVMTVEQRGIFDECQTVCNNIKENSHKILGWVAASRKQWNDSAAVSMDESPKGTTPIPVETEKASSDSRVSDDMLIVYEHMRDTLKFLYGEVMFIDPENMMNFAGHELKVMQGKQMFIETEHEMNVLMDYGLFQYKKNGKNVVQRDYDQNHTRYTDHRKTVLEAFQHARFSFLTIIKPINEHGVLVRDPLTAEEFLLIDKGLYQLIKSTLKPYALLTHYLQTPQFILTTGASVPVPLNSSAGMDMCRIFARLVNHHQHNEKLSLDTYQECIKDLYRMAIHEDLAKNVSSRALPMGCY